MCNYPSTHDLDCSSRGEVEQLSGRIQAPYTSLHSHSHLLVTKSLMAPKRFFLLEMSHTDDAVSGVGGWVPCSSIIHNCICSVLDKAWGSLKSRKMWHYLLPCLRAVVSSVRLVSKDSRLGWKQSKVPYITSNETATSLMGQGEIITSGNPSRQGLSRTRSLKHLEDLHGGKMDTARLRNFIVKSFPACSVVLRHMSHCSDLL